MNEIFFGINLFFLSLAFLVFSFTIIWIIGFVCMVIEEICNAIDRRLKIAEFQKDHNEIIKQIQKNSETHYNKKKEKLDRLEKWIDAEIKRLEGLKEHRPECNFDIKLKLYKEVREVLK